MAQDTGLIQKADAAGVAFSALITALAGRPAREVEQFLLGAGKRLTGTDSPIPEPLRSLVAPLLLSMAGLAALAPDAIADLAEGADRVLTGDK